MAEDPRQSDWTAFLADYTDYFVLDGSAALAQWNDQLDAAKVVLDAKHQFPDSGVEADWLTTQADNYAAHRDVMALDEYRALWKAFFVEYENSLRTVSQIWDDRFAQLQRFVAANARRPAADAPPPDVNSTGHCSEARLGQWLDDQFADYAADLSGAFRGNMWRQLDWGNFLDTHRSEFPDESYAIWTARLRQIRGFIDTNRQRPIMGGGLPDESTFAMWLTQQAVDYPSS